MLPSELLADTAAWTQHGMAVDRFNSQVGAQNPDACKWCLMGALEHCSANYADYQTKRAKLCRVLEAQGWTAGPVFFNDEPGRTHAEILALLKKAGL